MLHVLCSTQYRVNTKGDVYNHKTLDFWWVTNIRIYCIKQAMYHKPAMVAERN